MTGNSITDTQTNPIIVLRDRPVILAHDLADFFETDTSRINQYRARNKKRFTEQFAFQLTAKEMSDLTSQNVISSQHGGRRRPVWAYTEHGVAMISMGMKSERAIALSGVIIDTFVRYRNGSLPPMKPNELASSNSRL